MSGDLHVALHDLADVFQPSPVDAEALIRRHTRRKVGRNALTTGVIVAGAWFGLSTLGGPTGTGPTAFAVERTPTGVVRIEVVNTAASAKQMTRQLHEQGLNITIHAVPVSPQLVGTWIGFSANLDLLDSLRQQMKGYASTLEVPAEQIKEGLILDVGRAPKDGEEPTVIGTRNALAPGGELYCAKLRGATTATVQAYLMQHNFTAAWNSEAQGTPSPTPPPGRVVIIRLSDPGTGARTARVIVENPGSPWYDDALWLGFAPSIRAGATPLPPC